jgi:hypothetical protein
MKFSNTGRIPDFVFEKKNKMEKEAQNESGYSDLTSDPENVIPEDDFSIPDFSDLGPQSFKEHLNNIAEMAETNYDDIVAIEERISDLYDQYEVSGDALAPVDIGNPLDKAMALVEQLRKELSILSKLGKIANSENGMKKVAQMYWNGDDYYGEYPPNEEDDLGEMGRQEGWEDGQSEMQNAYEDALREEEEKGLSFPDLTEEFSNTSVVYDRFEIAPEFFKGEMDGYSLIGHGEYTDSSMLAGQYAQAKLDFFATLEEAQAKYPNVPISEDAPLSGKFLTGVPTNPPSDWSPADAGESWDEI